MGNMADTTYVLKNYSEEYAERIGYIDKGLELSYRYNSDVKEENIFVAVSSDGEVLGTGHLEPYNTWHLINNKDIPLDFVYHLKSIITLNSELVLPVNLRQIIINKLKERGKEIKNQYPDKNLRLMVWLSSDDISEIDFFVSNGFAAYTNSLVMKYDLTKDIPAVKRPKGISIVIGKMESEEELLKYYDATVKTFCEGTESLNYLRWFKHEPSWLNFSVYAGKQLISSVTTWTINDERSATEDIFVIEGWRKKGIAKYTITETLKYLKKQGKSIATLSMEGDNKPALSLYYSLGYRTYSVDLQFGYDL